MQDPRPCQDWHQTRFARKLLEGLAPSDVRLASSHGDLMWQAASDHGATTFAALARLREATTEPAFVVPSNNQARAAALATAQYAPTVPAAIAARFGDPHRWRGYDALDATRRFRAHCA